MDFLNSDFLDRYLKNGIDSEFWVKIVKLKVADSILVGFTDNRT